MAKPLMKRPSMLKVFDLKAELAQAHDSVARYRQARGWIDSRRIDDPKTLDARITEACALFNITREELALVAQCERQHHQDQFRL